MSVTSLPLISTKMEMGRMNFKLAWVGETKVFRHCLYLIFPHLSLQEFGSSLQRIGRGPMLSLQDDAFVQRTLAEKCWANKSHRLRPAEKGSIGKFFTSAHQNWVTGAHPSWLISTNFEKMQMWNINTKGMMPYHFPYVSTPKFIFWMMNKVRCFLGSVLCKFSFIKSVIESLIKKVFLFDQFDEIDRNIIIVQR